jgi:Heterokaryon incompatibility protein (HET)
MEHLPQPKGRVLNPIEVPYVVIEDIHAYDGERSTFSQFRETHGFDEQTIQRRGWNAYARSSPGGGQTESSRVVASFLQEWLFFGLLYEVLHEDFKTEDFLCKKEGSPWMITTSKLPGLLWSYKRRCKSMSHNQHAQAQRRTRTWACLDEASDFVNKFLGSESAQQIRIPLQEGIVLSITIIVGTLSAAAAEIYNRVNFIITRPKYVDRLLLNHRWCPTTLAMLERRGLGPQGMFYAAMLGPLPSDRDHSSCSKDGFECKANNVDQDTYQTAHRPDCMDLEHISKSNCPFEYVDHDRLCTEIESVETHPVIVVSNESDLTFRLDLQRSNPHQPFVAISHVWMDGMGNNNGNALARCQLWLLQRLVNSLYGIAQTEPIPFWIDTLCVPREPQESRKKAITKMAAVYQDADKVLVLDANLFANPLASCERDCTEIFMRILSTNWMRRLWTFQEAVLGTSLYFAFPDGVIDMQDSVSSLQTHLRLVSSSISQPKDSELPNIYPGQAISRTALEQYTHLRVLREKQEEERLAVMWNNMQWRSTSWTGDETICMAIILGFIPREIGEIQDIEVVYIDPTIGPEEKTSLEALQRTQLAARYKLFLKFLKRRRARVPMGLVFARGDKFDETGLRWAPSSFFRTAATGTIVAAEPTGQVTDAGLDVKAPGFELYLPPTPFKPRFVMLDELTSTFYDVHYATPLAGNKVRWEDLAPESIQDPALILAEDVALIAPDARIGVFGLLVSITRRTEQTLVATYLGRVFVRKFPASLMSWEALTKMKGVTRASEMKAGLMARLWNRRPEVPQSSGSPWVTSPEILDQMPDRWREDGAALNYELDYMFASSRYLLREQKWCLR